MVQESQVQGKVIWECGRDQAENIQDKTHKLEAYATVGQQRSSCLEP